MRARCAVCLLILMGSWVITGCDRSFLPPPPPAATRARSAPAYSATVTAAKEVVMVLPPEENADTASWEAIARQEAGLARLGFRSVRPTPRDPAGRQAELIKQVANTCSGLMVVTDGSPETTAALAALDPKKTPVVLLGRPLPASPEASKIQATLVTNAPYAESAKSLVAAAIEDARKRIDLAKGPLEAAVVRSKYKDDTSNQRADALAEAGKAAGLKIVADETFDGSPADFTRMLNQIVKDHPKLAILLCEEEGALSGLTAAVQEETPRPMTKAEAITTAPKPSPGERYRIVGYISTKANANLARMGQVTSLADRNVQRIARDALLAIRDKIEGKTVPAKIEIPVQIFRSQVQPMLMPGKP